MAITIQSTIGTQNLINQTNKNQNTLQDTLRTLASGVKSNSSASYIALSDQFTSQLRSLNQSTQNVNDGIAIAQVTNSGLSQIQDNFARLRELAVQSANDTLTDADRQTINQEAQQIQEQINSIIQDTNYNGISVLASNASVTLQTGASSSDQTIIQLQDLTGAFAPIDLSTQSSASTALDTLDTYAQQVQQYQTDLGAVQSGLESTLSTLNSTFESLTAATSRIQDVNMADQLTQLAAANIRSQAGVAILTQANQSAERVYSLLQ
ncbi:MAG: hypothetical protein H7832_12420 [Magnetococcus sp. DMHC-6]